MNREHPENASVSQEWGKKSSVSGGWCSHQAWEARIQWSYNREHMSLVWTLSPRRDHFISNFVIILIRLERQFPCGKDDTCRVISYFHQPDCQCQINTERPHSVSGKDFPAPAWFLWRRRFSVSTGNWRHCSLGSLLSLLPLTLWRAPLLSGIPGKLRASDPRVAFGSPSEGFPSEPWSPPGS